MIDVSIIIISYNTKEMTLACIRSVYDQTKDIAFEIIVVDNDSDDGSARSIEENFSAVTLIKSIEKSWFCKSK